MIKKQENCHGLKPKHQQEIVFTFFISWFNCSCFFFSKSSKKEFHKWKPNTAVSIVIQVLLALCLWPGARSCFSRNWHTWSVNHTGPQDMLTRRRLPSFAIFDWKIIFCYKNLFPQKLAEYFSKKLHYNCLYMFWQMSHGKRYVGSDISSA